MMALPLGGCGTPAFDSLAIPDVIPYTAEQQVMAADEMESQACPVLNEFINDYGVMRDQARAARGQDVDITR